jgi:hypothetical protein
VTATPQKRKAAEIIMQSIFLAVGISILALANSLTTVSAQQPADAGNNQRQDGTTDGRTVLLDVEPLERGVVFGCRMPVTLQVKGPDELVQFTLIVRALVGERELASSGFTLAPAIIRKRVAEGPDRVEPAARQFEFSPRVCLTMDGMRIVFARCEFEGYSSVDCLDSVRFVRAAADRPLYLEID